MNFTSYRHYYLLAKNFDNGEDFIFQYGKELKSEQSEENNRSVMDMLRFIFIAANGKIRELCNHAGITMTKFAKLTAIPYRSIQYWSYQSGCLPEQLRLLSSYCLFCTPISGKGKIPTLDDMSEDTADEITESTAEDTVEDTTENTTDETTEDTTTPT